MAIAIPIPGATPISVGTGAANALQLLGYTVNGAEISAEKVWEDVPGDQGGGEGGIPIDFQMYGVIHHIHLEMSKWDTAVQLLLESAVNQNGALSAIVAGKSPVPGSLILANAAQFRLLVNPPLIASLIRNYPICLPRQPHVYGSGTKWARLVMDWIAYPDLTTSPPTLFNSVIT